jgi:cardiolipin synthase
VQSPYFVPDQSIGDVLGVQAFAGVDVRLMMAGVHDKRLPWWAAFSYLDELVAAGGMALQYEAGFMHAKTLTVDGRLAAVGTTNFDIRSFVLHDELQVFFYDADVARRLDVIFEEDARHCREIGIEALEAIGVFARFRNAAARLFSRAM